MLLAGPGRARMLCCPAVLLMLCCPAVLRCWMLCCPAVPRGCCCCCLRSCALDAARRRGREGLLRSPTVALPPGFPRVNVPHSFKAGVSTGRSVCPEAPTLKPSTFKERLQVSSLWDGRSSATSFSQLILGRGASDVSDPEISCIGALSFPT